MNSNLLLISALSVFLLCSCDDDSSDPEPSNLIELNQKKWEDSNISTYTYTYVSYPNDCPTADAFPPVEITIVENVITNLYVPDLGTTLDVSTNSYPTIDDVFEGMNNKSEYLKGTPSFDETFGYPINYETDISELECDGYSVTISSFI